MYTNPITPLLALGVGLLDPGELVLLAALMAHAAPPPTRAPVAPPTPVTTAVPPAMPKPPDAMLPPPNAARPAELAAAPERVPPATPNPAALTAAPIAGAQAKAIPPVAIVATTAAVLVGFSQMMSAAM
ncbi:hypothetical protein D3C84_954010 [compost metagenome]